MNTNTRTSEFEDAEFGTSSPSNLPQRVSHTNDDSSLRGSNPTTPPVSPDANEQASSNAPVSPEGSSVETRSTTTQGRVESETEEILTTMPRRRFVQWLAGAASIGGVAAVTGVTIGQSILHYLARDPTLEEIARRAKAKKIAVRTVLFTLPNDLEIGKNCFISARPVGATAWDQINNIQNGVWGLAPNQFPNGGDIELTIGIIRNNEITFLDKPSLGTVKDIENIR